MKFTQFTAFLFSMQWMTAENDYGPRLPCCIVVSNTRIAVANIVDYSIQDTPLCPIRAVRFRTKKGRIICSDPYQSWAKKAMHIVYKKIPWIPTTPTTDKTLGRETKTSTTTTVPPVVTTFETSGPETSTSTTVPPVVMTIETSGLVTSTTTAVPPVVTTFETSGPETSTSTTVPPVVMTIETSGLVTSTTTAVPPVVTTNKTFGLETKISKSTIQPMSVPTEIPESTVTTFSPSTNKNCCLTVTQKKPAFHEIVDYRVQEIPLCSVRAVLFITVENNRICSSPIEDWVQDYIQDFNRRRKITERTDTREFAITRIKPLKQDRRKSIEITETFQPNGLSKVEKKQVESLVTLVAFEMHDRYKNTKNYFCLKKEQVKYFCIKQP